MHWASILKIKFLRREGFIPLPRRRGTRIWNFYTYTHRLRNARVASINMRRSSLLLIKASKKQYFLNFMGLNFENFKFISSGRLMAAELITEKAYKKSNKIKRSLMEYVKNYTTSPLANLDMVYLKPINKKNYTMLAFLKLSIKGWNPSVGFGNYHSTVTLRHHRIKKNTRKKLLTRE